jgi:DNA-binding SARP family transcriptional activator
MGNRQQKKHIDRPPRLRLLGTPQLLLPHGGSLLLERRGAALLALLALDGPAPRPRAAATIWPEVDERRACNSLRQRLWKLRQAAGRELVLTDPLLALAPAIEHDLGPPLPRLAADPAGCYGALLGDLDFSDCQELDQWVAAARQRWREQVARALAQLASQLESDGRIAAALPLAERLVSLEPTQEHAHRRVMRLHYLRGDRAAALAAFDSCRVTLRTELGVLPDRETQALEQLISQAALQAPRATPPAPISMLRPPVLVGRDEEWRRLTEASAARRNVLVVGEPGIGKSRLLADFASAHRGVVVRARPGDSSVPYAAIARLLRALLAAGAAPPDTSMRELARILPELGRPAAGPLEPLLLRMAIAACIDAAAAVGLRVAAFDDAQFADAASLELLPSVAAADPQPGTEPIQWLIAARAADLPAPLQAWSAAQDSDALTTLALGALDLAAVQALLGSLGLPDLDAVRWAPALLRHTGGNPMFILETLRALIDQRRPLHDPRGSALPVPADVGATIERRLAQLSAEALNLARVAALAGQDFMPELAAQVLARRVIDLSEPWRELEQAQVIRDRGFAHDLIVEALQRTLPRPIATSLHAAIARVLQQSQAPPARVAEQWAAAADYATACASFLAAADQARAVSRLDEELQLLVRADHCLQRGALSARRTAVLARALVAAFELGRFDEMRGFAAMMEQFAASPADRLLALEGRLRVQAQDLDFEGMLRTAGEALPLAEQVGSDLQRAFVHELRANALARLDRAAEAAESLAVCADWAQRNPDHPWASGMLVEIAATLSYLERYADSGAAAQRAYRAAERAGHVRHMHMASANIAMIAYVTGDVPASADEYERCRALALRYGGDSLQSWSHGASLARSLRLLGRYQQAMLHAQQQIDACRSGDPLGGEWWRVTAEIELAHCWFELGQPSRARGVLGDEPPANPDARFRWLVTNCRVAGAKAPRAHEWLAQATALAQGGMRSRGKRWTLAIEQCTALAPDEATDLLRRLADDCRAAGTWIYWWPLQMRLLQVLLAAGRAADALAVARELRAMGEERAPAGPYLPEFHLALHRAFDTSGDAVAAASALRAAVDWIRQALAHVPEAMRDAFKDRNPINRAVLTRASALS